MATINFYAPVNSQDLIAEIDSLTEADATSISVDAETGRQTTTFDLSEGRVLTVEGPEGPEGTADRFIVTEDGEEIFVVDFVYGPDLAGGYALGDYLAGEPVGFFGSVPGAVIVGYDQENAVAGQGDLFWGSAGTFYGKGGEDVILLQPDRELEEDVPGPVFGLGGAGDDRVVITDVTEALALGGAGDDLVGLVSGEGAIAGGAGADRMVMEGGTGIASGGAGADTFEFGGGAEADALSVRIVDFDPAEDTLTFAFDEGVLPEGVTTAADLAGDGTLAELGTVTFDGVTYAVGETAGDTWITRQGTSGAGTVYDDRILLDGVAAEDVALSSIALDLAWA